MDIEIKTTSIPLEVGVEKAGPQGLSAYQVAQKDGFVGTEQEWLASLKGEKGDIGETGPIGPAGPQGERGLTGATGPKGDKGDVGETGATGQPGRDGTNGIDGISPTVSTSKSGTTTTIEITDKNGTHTATINDGINGTNGRDGYVQYTAGDNITIENNVISATGGGSIPYYEMNVSNLSAGNRRYLSETEKDYLGQILTDAYSNNFPSIFINVKGLYKQILLKTDTFIITNKPTTLYLYSIPQIENADYTSLTTLINFMNMSITLTWSDNICTVSNATYNYTESEKFLHTDNRAAYTPTSNYHPATKKYVDDSIASAITTTLGGEY